MTDQADPRPGTAGVGVTITLDQTDAVLAAEALRYHAANRRATAKPRPGDSEGLQLARATIAWMAERHQAVADAIDAAIKEKP